MIGGKFQIDAVGYLGAQIFLVSFKGSNHLLGVAAAHRHHVDGCKAEVGGHAHFRYRNHVRFDNRIMHVTAREHVGERVPYQLANA